MSAGVSSDLAGKAAGGRKLIAVVYADMVGYSRLIGLDDAGTLRRLRTLRRALFDPAIAEYGGKLVQTGGDSLLIAFDSIDGAVRCVVKVQQHIPLYDGGQLPDQCIRFRIGVNIGDVIADGTDLHGDGVNVAVRLQAECPPGGICVSRAVRDHVGDRLGLQFAKLGPLKLKNIARPVEAFLLRLDTAEVMAAASLAPTLPDLGLNKAPRLSIAVLPIQNLSGDAEQEYLADAITEDLTTDLSQLPGAFVIARSSAFTYKGQSLDVKRIGEELGVRYVLQGSVRKVGDIWRVNTQLISTETGASLWSDRFDQALKDLGAGQDEIVARLRSVLNVKLIDLEGARSTRERANDPDAYDLILRARSMQHQPITRERNNHILALYEHALKLDPSSIAAMMGLTGALLAWAGMLGEGPAGDILDRASTLIAKAATVEPDHPDVLARTGRLLMQQERWTEAVPALQRLIDIHPSYPNCHAMLAALKSRIGAAAEAVPLFQTSLRLDPRSPVVYNTYLGLGFALLLLGRYEASIVWHERCLAASPEAPGWQRAWSLSQMAGAYAWSGQLNEARRALSEASRLEPHDTVRSHFPEVLTPVYMEQIERFREGLRLAGLRDHADEDADFRVDSDGELHRTLRGFTPMTAPGATTIRTSELAPLLADRRPLIIDTVANSWGRSITEAIGLRNAGVGGNFADSIQSRLRSKMATLTKGDLNAPIVAVGWNSERFDGRNLALRLVALGHRNVFWYRGGREAWEIAELSESELVVQDW
jgi:adenylate cyclase